MRARLRVSLHDAAHVHEETDLWQVQLLILSLQSMGGEVHYYAWQSDPLSPASAQSVLETQVKTSTMFLHACLWPQLLVRNISDIPAEHRGIEAVQEHD